MFVAQDEIEIFNYLANMTVTLRGIIQNSDNFMGVISVPFY
jgi:hypothetical protein